MPPQRIDALAFETHFLSHLAPVWRTLPTDIRGRFIVETALAGQEPDLEVEPLDGAGIRRLSMPKPVVGATGPTALVASYGDVKVGRRLGYKRFAFLEHGIGQSYAGDRKTAGMHGSYSGGIDREDNGLFLVPNAHSADRWRQRYPQSAVAIIGCPKLDTLPARQPGPGPVVALSFHWPAHVTLESGSAIGEYVPHLAEIKASVDALQGATLIGHCHPRFRDRMTRYFDRAGIPLVEDFADVCRRADLYVCDNSSTLYEFAATGRPVVVINSRHWRKHVRHGLRFWDAADVGIQVDDPARLGEAIGVALTDPPDVAAARERALAVVYGYRTGAAQRAAEAVHDWMVA